MANPDQARIPKGYENAGQWTSDLSVFESAARKAAGLEPNFEDLLVQVREKLNRYEGLPRPYNEEYNALNKMEDAINEGIWRDADVLLEFDKNDFPVAALSYIIEENVMEVGYLGATRRGAGLSLVKKVFFIAARKNVNIITESIHAKMMSGLEERFGFEITRRSMTYPTVFIPKKIVQKMYSFFTNR